MKIIDTMIIINSSNRVDGIKTHLKFPHDVMDWAYAVPHDQAGDYAEELGIKNDRVIQIPKYVPQFLSSQRQWIMEEYGNSYKYIWLMDDDLTFLYRTEDMKLKKCDSEQVAEMFIEMRRQLDHFPMVGISTRLGNNRVTTDYDDTNRVTRCYAMSTKAFQDVDATFAPFEPFLAQDFHMTLCFLNKGHNNRIIYTYAQEDIGSNAKGGCSSYRNQELQKKVAFWFADNHPEVTVKAKSSKNWEGYEGHRVDMTVQWKKAYKPVKVRAKGGLNARFKRNKK